MAVPKGVTPDLIGKVVTFNAFKRESPNSDTLGPMQKYVGTLEMYYSDDSGFLFKLVSAPEPIVVLHETGYVEVHPHDPKDPKNYVFG